MAIRNNMKQNLGGANRRSCNATSHRNKDWIRTLSLFLLVACSFNHPASFCSASHRELSQQLPLRLGGGDDVLKRVKERMESVMNVPVQAVNLLRTFHANQGFAPAGLHAAGRGRVFTYLLSLIQSFGGLKLYLGTEQGEYFALFIEGEAVYREPGNSGYEPDDPELSRYWSACVNGTSGELQNCTMADDDNFVQCVDDCELVPCPGQDHSQESQGATNETFLKWCPNYTVGQFNGTSSPPLGFVPVGYYCFDRYGRFSQEPGAVTAKYTVDGNVNIGHNGTCKYGDGIPVTRVMQGAFESCGGNGAVCNDTYTGLMRTINYDPRVRPWYISSKETQQAGWKEPYPFATHSNIIQKIGITYAEPIYVEDDAGRSVFGGTVAVDYTLYDISIFLAEAYGTQDFEVVIMEAAGPHHYVIGTSTGIHPYYLVRADDETVVCPAPSDDCVSVRLSAQRLGEHSNSSELDRVAGLAVQAQMAAGFPSNQTVTVKPSKESEASNGYLSRAIKYVQQGTDLQWYVMVVSPMEDGSSSDSIVPGDMLFGALIFVVALGSLGCVILSVLWYRNRSQAAVRHGDYVFTSAFMMGCIFLNLSSLSSLGQNSDTLCMGRFWSFNLAFSLTVSPLLVKVYRIYTLVGGGLRRRELSNAKAALRTIPIVAVEIVLLVLFTIVDPPRSVETIDYDASVPVQHFTCQQETIASMVTMFTYKACLVLMGCVMSYLSRNLDSRFGEAKQMLFGMYNIAFTGICFILLVAFAGITPVSVYMFQAIGVFWGTVVTCAVFVIPRLIQSRDDAAAPGRGKSSIIHVSGLSDYPAQPSTDFSVQPFSKAEGSSGFNGNGKERAVGTQQVPSKLDIFIFGRKG
jgi:hypothetical protein